LRYASLHTHTHYSLFDGVGTPARYAQRAVEIGMPAMAITDHGTLSGHREWARELKAVGVKPILGIEAYYTRDRFDMRDKSERTEPLDLIYNHLVVIAKNDQGLENLNTMNRLAWTEGFYKKPRIDWDLLSRYGEGLIITSACMSGVINKAIEVGEFASAKNYLAEFVDKFGEDFYVEVMPHNEAGMNAELIALADSMDIEVVVTPDCHHVDPSQKVAQELALLMQTHSKVRKEAVFEESLKYTDMMERIDYLYGDRRLSFRDFNIHLLSGDEMHAAMGDDSRPDMYQNTLDIADSVEEYHLPKNLNLLPVRYRKPDDKLRELAVKGLEGMGISSKEYFDRLDEELDVIHRKKFAPYFLMVQNIVSWAKDQGILVGAGRGSAAGSLVCYALGITEVDPIEYGLLFFRFIDGGSSQWNTFSGFAPIKR
jgi:DNA polymerase-3 subunit alpha